MGKKAYFIFHEAYLQYDFGPNHPWEPKRAVNFLEKVKKLSLNHQLVAAQKAKKNDIVLVHSKDYLKKVHQIAEQKGRLSIDTPLNLSILNAAYYSVGGSIKAAKLALERKKAINLLGGLHHAGISTSSGFCIFNDHAIAVRKLQQEKRIKKALIYDLDVHAGQGTQEIFYRDPTVYTVSLHQDPKTLYPGTGFSDQKGNGAGEGFNLNLPLPPGTEEEKYLQALDSVLPIYNQYKPDLVILVLGVDTYKKDPLANLRLEKNTYQKIGQRFQDLPNLAVMFAGGYSEEIANLWLSFLRGFL